MSKFDIKRKFDEIVNFAEVEKFLDLPVKRYSSGMYVRLAFSVAAHLDSDVLILDEVLAVGDVGFQRKCLGMMDGISRDGRTILFVSHGMQAVKSICTRAIFLDQGEVGWDGEVSEVISAYLRSSDKGRPTKVEYPELELPIQFLSAELVNSSSQQPNDVGLRFRYKINSKIDSALLCVEVKNDSDVSVFYANDEFWGDDKKRDIGTHSVMLSIPRSLLAPGAYSVAYGFWEPGREPIHFPSERLWFENVEEIITRLSSHNIAWPSIIYFPKSTWEREDL